MDKPIVNPELPFSWEIPGGVQAGRMARVQGVVSPHADRFTINLQTGPNNKPRDDTALHMSVRLKQNYIARNSYQDGAWGDEQGNGRLPIGRGQHFEIIILIDEADFKIAVNGQHFCEFHHRIPIEKITHLLVDGDAAINVISWEGNVASAPPSDGADVAKSASSVQSEGPGGPQGYGAPPQGYGAPPQGETPGGPQGYGAPPQGYGGPPQGQYGPPQGQYGPPQGQYGPPQGQQGYGPPPQGQQGYGPPPPPGSQPESGLDHFLQSAQSVLTEAIASGAAEKIFSGILGPSQGQGYNPQNAQYGQYPHPPQQQYQQPRQADLPQYGGEASVGGLGSVGSILGSLASQVFRSSQPQQGGQGQGQFGRYN